MNFFEHQDAARRNTRWLVILLLLAVTSLILLTAIAAIIITYFTQMQSAQAASGSFWQAVQQIVSWDVLAGISVAVGLVVAFGSVYKIWQLGGGGKTVAEAMGGHLITSNTRDANERKILNVVEEMAVASGTPVPPVYLLEEAAINAFAAGFQPQDAVIGITRGCIEQLSRNELQGVVAHEFSHILHGDMRLNIRLVGLLHGILVLGLIGYYLLRSARYSGLSRRRNNPAALLALGLALIVIGYAGTFFGNIIKAAVSRQREFLADASAVQFTRNPDGIAGALKKIGGHSTGSRLQNSGAAEFSHLLFGQGVKLRFNALMATHPPLTERIRRIDPQWDGSIATTTTSASSQKTAEAAQASQFAGAAAGMAATANAVDSIGAPSPAHIQQAQQTLQDIPEALREAAHDPFSARAIVYCLLLDNQCDKTHSAQWQSLRAGAHPIVYQLTEKLATTVSELPRVLHLPLLELSMPALKSLSEPQSEVFKRNLIALIKTDSKVNLFEWALYRIVNHNLAQPARQSANATLKQRQEECRQLLSMLAQAGANNNQQAATAYAEGLHILGLGSRVMVDQQLIKLPTLDRALDRLNQLKPLQKPVLLKALAACIHHDGRVTSTEAELFRAIADSLNCPVPPLLPDQQLAS